MIGQCQDDFKTLIKRNSGTCSWQTWSINVYIAYDRMGAL